MTLRRKLREAWAASKWGAALTVALGVFVLLIPNTPVERLSYDLPYRVRPEATITEAAIVYMDDLSHYQLNQPYDGAWDRSLHARLLDRLGQAGAKAIAFDILFPQRNTNASAADAMLAQAIRMHGPVVLAADLGTGEYYTEAVMTRPVLPNPLFLEATPYWGFTQLWPDGDRTIRQHFHGSEEVPSLSWTLATVLGTAATKTPNALRAKWRLNYYGDHGTIPGMSYHQALTNSGPADVKFFRNRVVFIGSGTKTGFSGSRPDLHRTPFSMLWYESLWPGVEIHATEFLNLLRGDWLARMDPLVELGLVIVCGVLAGLGLGMPRPQTSVLVGVLAAALVALVGCFLVWQTHIWFSWLVIAGVQIPVALAYSIVRKAEQATIPRPADLTTDFTSSGTRTAVMIPDYEMIRRIGSGSYGEVWLARSATGTFRAVKVVDRKSAQDPRFLREFAGLQSFEPISRAHEGLVHILHVGRKEAGQLYYVMELADSCSKVSGDDAEGYVPATLKTKLQARGSLDVDELARLSLALTSALAFLHERGLMHRDIKPSNIIFVQGRPKLADIGLVAAADETHSFVGTEGYIPPEGPGTPAADVYSLGKVLSELLTETYHGSAADKKLRQLRHFVDQACARDLSERPRNGQEMLEKLKEASAG